MAAVGFLCPLVANVECHDQERERTNSAGRRHGTQQERNRVLAHIEVTSRSVSLPPATRHDVIVS